MLICGEFKMSINEHDALVFDSEDGRQIVLADAETVLCFLMRETKGVQPGIVMEITTGGNCMTFKAHLKG